MLKNQLLQLLSESDNDKYILLETLDLFCCHICDYYKLQTDKNDIKDLFMFINKYAQNID